MASFAATAKASAFLSGAQVQRVQRPSARRAPRSVSAADLGVDAVLHAPARRGV